MEPSTWAKQIFHLNEPSSELISNFISLIDSKNKTLTSFM